MKIRLEYLDLFTRQSVEKFDFSRTVTFIYGPIGQGKSTVARLVDYCLGGKIERTPALQKEFVSCTLSAKMGSFDCKFERGAQDTQKVRVSWIGSDESEGSVNAPLVTQTDPLIEGYEVFSLSDLIFHFCGMNPIKVRESSRDPNSPLVRLSFRDIWWYCYLEQTHLDSSFFRLEDPARSRKSQDAMRFFTGLHSERLSELDEGLIRARDEQRTKRETVEQIRKFMNRFEFDSEADLELQLSQAVGLLSEAENKRSDLDRHRQAETHPTDDLRKRLRELGDEIDSLQEAVADSQESIAEQRSLRAEFVTAKTKATRTAEAGKVFDDVEYDRCPDCGVDISDRPQSTDHCRLCGSPEHSNAEITSVELEVLRRDLNERIDQITDALSRKERQLTKTKKELSVKLHLKRELDRQLQDELRRYDSAFIESIRVIEREIATMRERINSLQRLRLMPQAIGTLLEEAGLLQGQIDRLRSSVDEERFRLKRADRNIASIADEFKRILLSISYPGMSTDDSILIEPKNWRPIILHEEQAWSFWETGSGGKKTLFNVCYALAIHSAARKNDMPVPNILMIDSPTKNISEDEDPELVRALYDEIYRLVANEDSGGIQFLIIDSDLVQPAQPLPGFLERRMAGERDAPSLIPYYDGP